MTSPQKKQQLPNVCQLGWVGSGDDRWRDVGIYTCDIVAWTSRMQWWQWCYCGWKKSQTTTLVDLKPCKLWKRTIPIKWCRISSIKSYHRRWVFWQHFPHSFQPTGDACLCCLPRGNSCIGPFACKRMSLVLLELMPRFRILSNQNWRICCAPLNIIPWTMGNLRGFPNTTINLKWGWLGVV